MRYKVYGKIRIFICLGLLVLTTSGDAKNFEDYNACLLRIQPHVEGEIIQESSNISSTPLYAKEEYLGDFKKLILVYQDESIPLKLSLSSDYKLLSDWREKPSPDFSKIESIAVNQKTYSLIIEDQGQKNLEDIPLKISSISKEDKKLKATFFQI